ncbi:hypothetical protein JVW18_18045, partial [Vibrio cholerae O1]|nr:hypothetical protein [Vibrio cholerae O1]
SLGLAGRELFFFLTPFVANRAAQLSKYSNLYRAAWCLGRAPHSLIPAGLFGADFSVCYSRCLCPA